MAVLLLAHPPAAHAGEAPEGPPEPLVVGCPADKPPLSEQRPGDVPAGLLIDAWRLWEKQTGHRTVFRCGRPDALMADLAAGRIHVHAGIADRGKGGERLAFGAPLYPISSALVLRRELGPRPALEDRSVGVLQGSARALLAAAAFPKARVTVLASREALEAQLAGKTLDAVLIDTAAGTYLLRNPATSASYVLGEARYLESELRPAVLPSRRSWLGAIDEGFAAIDPEALGAAEKRWISDPSQRHLSARSRQLTLSSAERAFLAAHPVVRYGLMGTDWAPAEIVDAGGRVTGITPEIRDIVAARLGVRFELVHASGWTALDGLLRRREIDVTGSLADAPARRSYLTVTRPYLSGDLGVVSRDDQIQALTLSDLPGRRVAMESGYATTLWLERNVPSAEILLYPDTASALHAVSEGRADAHFGPVLTSTHMLRQLLLSNLRVAGATGAYPFELRFGVRSDWPLLVTAIDKAVASISADERAAIRDRWMAATVIESRDWAGVLRYALPAGVVLLAAVVAVGAWNRRLHAEIARRRAAQSALAEQIAWREALLDALPEPVVFKDAQGRYLGCNRAFETFYAVRRDQLIGRSLAEVQHIGTTVRADVEAADAPVLKDGITRTVRFRTARHDGAQRDIVYSLSALPAPGGGIGGLIGVILDVTDLEAARAQAREAAELLRDIANAAPGIVWRFVSRPGERGRFSFVSEGIRPLHGIGPDAAMEDPRRVFETMVPEDRAALVARINAAANEEPAPFETEYRTRLPDGQQRWLAISVRPRPQADGAVHWDGTAFDITREKQLQRELARARAAADTANEAKSRFLAKMSHEIRTPLAGMIGLAQLLRAVPPPPDPLRLVGLIESASENLLRVLNDILDISKIEAGKLHIDNAPFDLVALAEQATGLATSMLGNKPIALDLEIAPGLPRWVRGDALRLRQIIDNLLSNAAKFTERGRIVLSVDTAGLDQIRIEVRDSGIGMDEVARARLFEPYEQARNDTARKYGGTGLGLAICRELVALMGGGIGADSEPGQGSCFWVVLPLPVAAPDRIPADAGREPTADFVAPTTAEARKRGLVVLVADDDEIYREVLVRQLERLGCVVEHYRNGAEARDAFERHPGRYGMLITDIHMPVMDGLTLVRTLHASGARSTPIPVLVLSATTAASDAELPTDGGTLDFTQKPIPLAALDGTLRARAPAIVAHRREPLAPAATAESPPAGAPDFNRGALAGLLGTDDPAMLASFSRSAVRSLSALVPRITAAVESGDAARVMEAAHAGKGGAASAGAERIAALLGEMHSSARAGDWQALQRGASAIAGHYAAFASAVEAAFGAQPSAERAPTERLVDSQAARSLADSGREM